MRTHWSLCQAFVSFALALVAAIPAVGAAQTQRAPVDTKPIEVRRSVNETAKPVALEDARAQAARDKRVQSLEQQVAALQASEAALQKQIVALQRALAAVQATALPVQRQGSNYIVTVPAGLTLHAASVTVQGDAAMALKAGAGMDISAAMVDVTAPTRIGLKGATISLNAASNGKAAARVGDDAICDSQVHCNIARGSASVIIGN